MAVKLIGRCVIALGYTQAIQNSRLDTISTAADVGTASLLRIYDSTRPTNADTAVGAQVLLATLTMTDPVAAGASSGVWTASAIADDTSAAATGTASWFRLVTSAGAAVLDGDVSTAASDLNLNSTSITAGGTVSVTSWTITAGNA